MKLPSVTVAGVLSERKMIHSTGTSAHTTITKKAPDHPVRLRARWLMAASRPRGSRLRCGPRCGGAEPLEEHERDRGYAQEQEHRDRGAKAQIEPIEQRRVVEHRDRLGALRTLIEDVDHVKNPELVERAEQQRNQ